MRASFPAGLGLCVTLGVAGVATWDSLGFADAVGVKLGSGVTVGVSL